MSGHCASCGKANGHTFNCPANDVPQRHPKRKAAKEAEAKIHVLASKSGQAAKKDTTVPAKISDPVKQPEVQKEELTNVSDHTSESTIKIRDESSSQDTDSSDSYDSSDSSKSSRSHSKGRLKKEEKRARQPDKKAHPMMFGKIVKQSSRRIIVDMAYRLNSSLPRDKLVWESFQTIGTIGGWILLLLQEEPGMNELSNACPTKNSVIRTFDASIRAVAPDTPEETLANLSNLFRYLNCILVTSLADEEAKPEVIEAILQQFSNDYAWKLNGVMHGALRSHHIGDTATIVNKFTRARVAKAMGIPTAYLKEKKSSRENKKGKKRFQRGKRNKGGSPNA